jgi:hypothetical protein
MERAEHAYDRGKGGDRSKDEAPKISAQGASRAAPIVSAAELLLITVHR